MPQMPLTHRLDTMSPSDAAAVLESPQQAAAAPTAESAIPFPRIHTDQPSVNSLTRSRGNSTSLALRRNLNLSTASLASKLSLPHRTATLEVYDLMYGNAPQTFPADAVERLYETNAGKHILHQKCNSAYTHAQSIFVRVSGGSAIQCTSSSFRIRRVETRIPSFAFISLNAS